MILAYHFLNNFIKFPLFIHLFILKKISLMETHKNGDGSMWMTEAWEILVPRICFQKCILHRLIFSNLGRLTQHFYIWTIWRSRICLENKLLSLAFRPQSSIGGLDNWFGLAIYSNNLKCPSHSEFCRLSSSYTTSNITWWNRDHYSPIYFNLTNKLCQPLGFIWTRKHPKLMLCGPCLMIPLFTF